MTAPATATRTQTRTVAEEIAEIDRAVKASVETSAARKRLAPFLAVGQSYDRIAAQVRESMIKTPKLAECDPNTIVDAVVTIQRWRLEIGETAYLVPFSDRKNNRWVCTAIRGYIGDIELLINNGLARRVDAFCVYSKEPFTYREGTSPVLEHQPLPPSQRGQMIGAYAILWQTFTNSKAVFLYVEEIEAIRQQFSKQWREGDLPTWYAKKCAVKAVTKLLPKSPKLAKLRDQMDEDEIVVASVERGIESHRERPAHVDDDGVDLEDDDRLDPTASNAAASTTSVPSSTATARKCPSCEGPMWDNRPKKESGEFAANRPDFSCKDKACKGAIWPERKTSRSNTQGSIPGLDEDVGKKPTDALAAG